MTQVLVKNVDAANYKQEITAGSHKLAADVPKDKGGDETAPNPHELLLASLGACTTITLQMYAKNKNWDLKKVSVNLTHEDVEDPANPGKKLAKITRDIQVEGELTEEQVESLKVIADKCPIHKILQGPKTIETAIKKN